MTWHGMLHCHQMVGLFSFSGLSQTACIYCRVVQHGLLLVLTASIISGQLLDTLMLCSLFTGAIFEVSMKLSPAHFASQSQSVCISAWNVLSWINAVTEDAYDSYSPQVPHRPWHVCAHDMHKHCGLTFNCHVTWTDIMSPCCVCGTTYHNLTRSCIVLLPLTWFLSPMIRWSGKAKEKGKFFLLIFLFSLFFGWVRKWWISCAVIFIAVWGLLLINLHARHVLAHCQGVILMFREQT